MNINIPEETCDEIVVLSLEETLKDLKSDLAKSEKEEKASGIFSYDYYEDNTKLKKMIESIETTLSWYKA